METLYFILPITGMVLLIGFTISRINTRSYPHRRVERTFQPRDNKHDGDMCPRERLEQRYVDWFTREEGGGVNTV